MAERGEKVPQFKLTVVQYAILAVFVVLTMRLGRLQVSNQEEYEALAEQNRVRKMPILAPRGKILDRDGRIIVDNYPSTSVLLLREQLKTNPPDIDKIAAGLHMPAEEIRSRIRRFAAQPPTQPMVLKDDVTPDELAFLEAHRNELPQLDTIMVQRRLYPKNGFMAHVIGYVGEVSEQMLNDPRYELYEPGDVVGRSGVEEEYNDWLMGQDGHRNVIVNSHGKEVGRKDETPATPGKPLKLTIDLDLQIAAEEALNASGKNGAIVALDPRTGEVLALASRPVFDPNHFAVRISRDEWNALLTDDGKPLMNKATQAQLAPGSVFKIIMSVAGLQEGIAQNLHVYCPGGATFYGRFFKCWIGARGGGHGAVDIHSAIPHSCDVFFYTLAERLGIGKIAKWATALGLGQRTGIDLPQEATGVMPSEEWKIKNFKQKWYAGETISVGIGQGAVATTPIQLARAIGGITSGGMLRRPHVVNPVMQDKDFKYVSRTSVPDEVKVPLDPDNWTTITDGMAAVTQPGGTAAASHLEGIDFAGKTGSAQVVSNDARKLLKGSQFKDNGWFAGVEPRRNPEIVVVVLIEEGEHGAAAAHLAADVIKAYVDKERRTTKVARASGKPIEMAALWSSAAESGEAGAGLGTGTFHIAAGRAAKPAKTAPGMGVAGGNEAFKPRVAAAAVAAGGAR